MEGIYNKYRCRHDTGRHYCCQPERTVANPARGLLNRENKNNRKSSSTPPPPMACCSYGGENNNSAYNENRTKEEQMAREKIT